MYPGLRAVEIISEPKKTVCYCPWKRPEMTKSASFDDVPIFVYPGPRAVEIASGAKKLCPMAHGNGHNWPNRRVLTTSQFFCARGHELLKSSPEPKTVCYSPRKRPEITKSMSFDDVQIFVYPGSPAVEIVPEPKTVCYFPWKRPEITKSTSFDDVPIFMYRGSRAVEIVTRAKNCVL